MPFVVAMTRTSFVASDVRSALSVLLSVPATRSKATGVMAPVNSEATVAAYDVNVAVGDYIRTAALLGARVGEIVLHFSGGKQKRSLVLEHQVSVFYELAVHNTRDEPPEGSPASIALSWLDDGQERHVNLGIPVAATLKLRWPEGGVEERLFLPGSYRIGSPAWFDRQREISALEDQAWELQRINRNLQWMQMDQQFQPLRRRR